MAARTGSHCQFSNNSFVAGPTLYAVFGSTGTPCASGSTPLCVAERRDAEVSLLANDYGWSEIGKLGELLAPRCLERFNPGCIVDLCAVVPLGKQRVSFRAVIPHASIETIFLTRRVSFV